ncbi:YpoC family protein [Bacillus sp. JJ1764]|uniref:YpoC family protein n=1 Tax=Bacillus sp. JJ1764 TaxID=3122964 RepID=UPI002FFD75B5
MDDQMIIISSILKEWEGIQPSIEKSFRERNQIEAKKLMDKGIQLFIEFLMVANNQPYSDQFSIPYQKLEWKPVNLEERLKFIMSRPNLHHSYRQLSELVTEQKKQLAKKNIQRKTSRP